MGGQRVDLYRGPHARTLEQVPEILNEAIADIDHGFGDPETPETFARRLHRPGPPVGLQEAAPVTLWHRTALEATLEEVKSRRGGAEPPNDTDQIANLRAI